MKINCETPKGGAVVFNDAQNVWASYAVAGVGGAPAPELFYASLELPHGKSVSFFVNRETGLVVVDVIDADEKGGVEILRHQVQPHQRRRAARKVA